MDYSLVSECIDKLCGEYLDFLEDVCNIESNSYNQNGVNKVADYIVNYETKNNYFIDRVSFEKAGDCLCLDWINRSENPFVVLSAHMDTVYKDSDFSYPAVKRDNKYIYGPGVCDCKGGIAVGLLTMSALKKCGFKDINIRLVLQSDEEVSSSLSNKETIKYICEKSRNCIAFFNLEGKYPGKLTLERGGILHVMFTVTGKSAHSKDIKSGANSINEAAFKIAQIARYKSNDKLSFNCGMINGGSASNVVPDKCSFHVEARVGTKKEYDTAINYFKEISLKQYVPGTKTEFEIVSDRLPMELKDFNIDLYNKINEVSIKYGFGKIETRKSAGGSDAAYTTDAGIPTADGMGIIGYNLHSIGEKAEIKSLSQSAKLLAAIIMELS